MRTRTRRQGPATSGGRRALVAGVACAAAVSALAVAPAQAAHATQAKQAAQAAQAAQAPQAPRSARATVRAKVVGTVWGDKAADAASRDTSGAYDPRKDAGSLYSLVRGIHADAVWATKDAKGKAVTGQGVTVAVVDSGVRGVPGLDAPGKLVQGPDLSLESNNDALSRLDTFGHGTHLAGIIGARDRSVAVDARTGGVRADPKKVLGVAPGAGLLGLKLATTDGSTDVSQVIAALDWVAAHRHDRGMDVRVINLSFGTTAVQPYQVDPLAAAAEHAWRKGIVVVVSGGNQGASAGSLTNPAIDPYVIAVGAADPQGRTSWATPKVADFSSRGTAARHVDLLAPGRSVVSLRTSGS